MIEDVLDPLLDGAAPARIAGSPGQITTLLVTTVLCVGIWI